MITVSLERKYNRTCFKAVKNSSLCFERKRVSASETHTPCIQLDDDVKVSEAVQNSWHFMTTQTSSNFGDGGMELCENLQVVVEKVVN